MDDAPCKEPVSFNAVKSVRVITHHQPLQLLPKNKVDTLLNEEAEYLVTTKVRVALLSPSLKLIFYDYFFCYGI